MTTPQTDSALSPRARWTIVGLLSASITINLLDRQILSVLASELRTQFQWTNAQYGYICSSAPARCPSWRWRACSSC